MKKAISSFASLSIGIAACGGAVSTDKAPPRQAAEEVQDAGNSSSAADAVSDAQDSLAFFLDGGTTVTETDPSPAADAAPTSHLFPYPNLESVGILQRNVYGREMFVLRQTPTCHIPVVEEYLAKLQAWMNSPNAAPTDAQLQIFQAANYLNAALHKVPLAIFDEVDMSAAANELNSMFDRLAERSFGTPVLPIMKVGTATNPEFKPRNSGNVPGKGLLIVLIREALISDSIRAGEILSVNAGLPLVESPIIKARLATKKSVISTDIKAFQTRCREFIRKYESFPYFVKQTLVDGKQWIILQTESGNPLLNPFSDFFHTKTEGRSEHQYFTGDLVKLRNFVSFVDVLSRDISALTIRDLNAATELD